MENAEISANSFTHPVLQGNAYGHPNAAISDGDFVFTSKLLSVDFVTGIAETKNTIYAIKSWGRSNARMVMIRFGFRNVPKTREGAQFNICIGTEYYDACIHRVADDYVAISVPEVIRGFRGSIESQLNNVLSAMNKADAAL